MFAYNQFLASEGGTFVADSHDSHRFTSRFDEAFFRQPEELEDERRVFGGDPLHTWEKTENLDDPNLFAAERTAPVYLRVEGLLVNALVYLLERRPDFLLDVYERARATLENEQSREVMSALPLAVRKLVDGGFYKRETVRRFRRKGFSHRTILKGYGITCPYAQSIAARLDRAPREVAARAKRPARSRRSES